MEVLLAIDARDKRVGFASPGVLADLTDLALVASKNCSHSEAGAIA